MFLPLLWARTSSVVRFNVFLRLFADVCRGVICERRGKATESNDKQQQQQQQGQQPDLAADKENPFVPAKTKAKKATKTAAAERRRSKRGRGSTRGAMSAVN